MACDNFFEHGKGHVMKILRHFAVIGLACCGAATQVAAFSFVPPDTMSHLKGEARFGISTQKQACKVKMNFKTSASGPRQKFPEIISVSMSPPGPCTQFDFYTLPWPVYITGANTAVIDNFAFSSAFGGCESGPVPISINSAGQWDFQGTYKGCRFTGTFGSEPVVTISN
jgi:hypothetical protein